MSASFHFAVRTIGLSKVGGRKPCSLLNAARHNLREIQAELGSSGRIDASRTASNEIFTGPADAAGVVALAQQVAESAGVDLRSLRRDHVQALEILFTLSADTALDTGDYFRRCLAWVRQAFAGVAVLSATLHTDESAPHAHVLLAPIRGGRHVGSALVDRSNLAKLRESFWQTVAGPAGLKRAGGKLHGQAKRWAIDAVMRCLDGDPVTGSAIMPLVRRHIESDPMPFLQALGIDPQSIRPGVEPVPANPIGIKTQPVKPIGIEEQPAKKRTQSCVGFARSPSTVTRLALAREAEQSARQKQAKRQPTPEHWTPEVLECDGGIVRIRDNPGNPPVFH